MNLQKLYELHETSEEGLSADEAKTRLEKYGANELPHTKEKTVVGIFISQFLNPLIYVLLFAGGISLFLHEIVDAYFIFGVLIFNAIIGTVQEYSASRSAAALREMVKVKAFVIREGQEKEILASELVPGDIVVLRSGNKLPADVRLVKSNDLYLDESMLTGESLPVEKNANATVKSGAIMSERKNEAFAGTMVVRGIGRGIVTATGLMTQIGKIAESVTGESEVKAPLILRMEKFSYNIAILMVFTIAVLASIYIYRGAGMHETFLLAASLAVAAIPEGLPITITITLAIGMSRMAKRNVIVRNLVAVESLGSCTMIASDKTGTLTKNELTVEEIALPTGSFIKASEAVNREYEKKDYELGLDTLLTSVLANEATVDGEEYYGDAMDIAFLKFANFFKEPIVGIIHEHHPQVGIVPYDSEIRYSASFNVVNDEVYAFVKGAPETIMDMCSLTEEQRKLIESQLFSMAEKGMKVLAMASKKLDDRKNKASGDEEELYNEDDLKELNFTGMVGVIDPLRSETKDAIKECRSAGIDVAMITGDNPITAYKIGSELDLIKDKTDVVSGKEIGLAKIEGEGALNKLVTTPRVFARIEPNQKLDIVRSFANNGHFVAVTGDGVNDAPALKNAHVGVAMGKHGTDVARESADIILTDDNFSSIVHGIEEGRITYSNIRKLIFLLVSTGMAEIGIFIVAVVAGLPIPFFAAQLLWLNLVAESIQGIALSMERGEGDEMKKPPKEPDEAIFDKLMIGRLALSTAVMTFVTIIVYKFLIDKGFGVDYARNIILMLMILFENMQTFNSRSEHRSVFRHSFKNNKKIIFCVLGAMLVHIIATYIPGINTALKMQPITLQEWLFVLPIAFSLIVFMELEKYIRRIWKRKNGIDTTEVLENNSEA